MIRTWDGDKMIYVLELMKACYNIMGRTAFISFRRLAGSWRGIMSVADL